MLGRIVALGLMIFSTKDEETLKYELLFDNAKTIKTNNHETFN